MQVIEKYFLEKIKRENIPKEVWMDFISTYVQQVSIRPWLVPGSMILIDQLELWHPQAQYGIILSAGDYRGRIHELRETLLHELIHIALYVMGFKKHSEEYVEDLCQIFAQKYPFIIDIFEEVFPGLFLDEETLGRAFYSPVRIFLPTP